MNENRRELIVMPKLSFSANPSIDLMRNPARILNHSELMSRKIEIGRRYGLVHGGDFSPEIVEENLETVGRMMGRQLSFYQASSEIIGRLSLAGSRATETDLAADMWNVFGIGLLEWHITDRCDLGCPHCFYGSGPEGSQATIPLSEFDKLKLLAPKAVVITGGGEPTVYRDGDNFFADAMQKVTSVLPDVQLGIQTNGTVFPKGDWTQNFLYHRSSVDADNPVTFTSIKSRDFFDRTVENTVRFAQTDIPFVGVGFLFQKDNADEIPNFVRMFHDLIMRRAPETIGKFTIQFRPLGPDLTQIEDIRAGRMYYPEGVTDAQIESVRSGIAALRTDSPAMADFIDKQTNVTSVYNGNSGHPINEFDNCYVSLAYRMVRAGGDNFPCFIIVKHEEYSMGNFLEKDPRKEPEAYLQIAMGTYYFFNLKSRFCKPEFCRQSFVNQVAGQGMNGILPAPEGEMARIFFF